MLLAEKESIPHTASFHLRYFAFFSDVIASQVLFFFTSFGNARTCGTPEDDVRECELLCELYPDEEE